MRVTARYLLPGAATIVVAAVSAHDLVTTRVTWVDNIAPIVEARCLACHSTTGPAVSFATYDDARPYAVAIREEVLARRMPKWPVVRGYGDFSNDPSLSMSEITMITAWVDGGAPETATRGASSRPLATPRPSASHAAGTEAETVPSRGVSIACVSGPLPAGSLAGLELDLPVDGSIRLTVHSQDGSIEPLVWVDGFEPDFAEPLWLRTPWTIGTGARLDVDALTPGPCAVTLHYLDQRAASSS